MADSEKMSAAWREARRLLVTHRRKLAFGVVLMVVNRLSGSVLPWASKYLVDTVLAKNKLDMLWPIARAVGRAITNFSLSQIVSVTAQEAIMNMRRQAQEPVTRLPIRYFDETKTGLLISRIMTAAEGHSNLARIGIVQLVGGVFTAVFALGPLFWISSSRRRRGLPRFR